MTLESSKQQRVIRVFISSTFRDMQEERDELVKYTFPKLRALCESRGVVWGEVDLRWGITDEEKAEGKVLPLCLEEIKNCRPYFIGLLGERYGWVPDEILKQTIEAEPWLQEHLNHSVTELEILHGVLRNPDMAGHAFFYFRDPSYVDKLPEDTRKDFVEEVAEDEVKRFGYDTALLRANDRRDKLALLKDRVRKSGFSVRENYPDPRALGEVVLKDITSVIDKLFPEGSNPDPLDREASDHEQFAKSRASVYIGRQEYFERLNQHAKSDAQPLAVLGDSGSGKSALLSTWALRYKEKHPNDLLIMHFIGATQHSADWMAMIRRIMGEFKRQFNIEGDIPDKPDELKMAFANWLHMASAKGKVILILDAINQLEDRDGALDIAWMPPYTPPNIRIMVSTLPGRSLEEIEKRGWQTLKVEPLNKEEKRELLAEYLKQYSKKLTKEQSEIIADAQQTANPLFLRALLEELRLYGDHFKIDERIKHYLNTSTIDDLYEKILERYEQDYERDRPGLVRDSFSLIWAARRGLSETELLEILGTDGLPLPAALWSPLHLAAKDSLVNRSGLINFSHDYLRKAVEDRYLSTDEEQCKCHFKIAEYFKNQLSAGVSINRIYRPVDELPWQLVKAKEWDKLYIALSNLLFLKIALKTDQFEVMAYWTTLEDNTQRRMIDAYRHVIENPEEYNDYIDHLVALFWATGHHEELMRLREYQINLYREKGEKQYLAEALCYQAGVFIKSAELDKAMQLLKESERINRVIGDKAGLSESLGNQAAVLIAQGELSEALELCKEQERLSKELGDKRGVFMALGNRALILCGFGRLNEALEFYNEQERLCRELGDMDCLSRALGNQAVTLHHLGRPNEAIVLYKKEESLCRQFGFKDRLTNSLSNQALL